MSSNEALKTIAISKFKSFCKHSTLHGFYYFHKASEWTIHFLWAMIIAASMALCCFLGHMIWVKFVIDPTLTVVETTHYSMTNIPFPAVTVCDSESVYLPKTQDITELMLLRGFNQSEISDFYKSFSAIKGKSYMPQPHVKKMHSLLEDIGYPLKLLLNMFKRPCGDMIVECNWRSRPHNCSEMFRSISTTVGHCCAFDMPYFTLRANTQTNIISGVDPTEALEITVSGRDYTRIEDEANGYPTLYVYDMKDKVTLIDSPISLTPESYFDVNVLVWAIDSSSYVKALPLSSRKCILDGDKATGGSFYQDCMTRLILKRVVNHCRCLPFDYTAKQLDVEEYPVCFWERLICIYQKIELVQVEIKDIISTNECYQRCDYVQYETEVTFIKNKRHFSTLNESHSKVQVHFGETTCMKYRREVLYTWDQMLANLGGIFGLCLGGSVISVIELIWFLFDLFFAVLKTLWKKPIAPLNKDKDKIFTVYQKNNMVPKKIAQKKLLGKYKFVN